MKGIDLVNAMRNFLDESKSREEKSLIDFGEKLREIRQEKGLTQEHLSLLAGLTRTSITNMERGKQDTTITTIIRLCCAMDCEISDLFPKEKEQNNE